MSEVKWIKLSTQIFDDEKIQLIEAMPEADTIFFIWVRLLVQAGKTNADGDIYLTENIPYSEEMLATIFRRPLPKLRLALKTLLQLDMIEMNGNKISVTNWEKHQNTKGLEEIREKTRLRVQKFRQKKLENGSKSNNGNVTVTESNALDLEVDKNKNKNKEKDLKKADKKQSAPPDNLFNYLLNKWAELYFESRGTKYILSGIDSKALGFLLKGYKKTYPEKNTEVCKTYFEHLFRGCLSVQDKFYYNGMTLSLLNSHQNQIINHIKGGNDGQELAKIVFDRFNRQNRSKS